MLGVGVKNYPNGKNIINILKINILLLHLAEYGVHRLRPTLYLEIEMAIFELLLNWLNKATDKPVSA